MTRHEAGPQQPAPTEPATRPARRPATAPAATPDSTPANPSRRNFLIMGAELTGAGILAIVGGAAALRAGKAILDIPGGEPVAGASMAPTASPDARPTTAPSAAPASPDAAGLTAEQMKAIHEARLKQLDPIYRTEGLNAWLVAAGFRFYGIKDARQIEEETLSDGTIVASGVQVKVTKLTETMFPEGFTTDQPVTGGRSFQPDPKNPSKIWTDVPEYTGNATLYADLSNWGQLNPLVGK